MPSLNLNSPNVGPNPTSQHRARFSSSPPSSSPPRSPPFTFPTVAVPLGGGHPAQVPHSHRSNILAPLYVPPRPTAGPTTGPTTSSNGSMGTMGTLGYVSPPASAGSPSKSTQSVAPVGLLVPTDRGLEDLEENWIPRLGKLKVDREVRIPGYTLYGIRSWYLSRTHWAFTIVVSSGKPTDLISCYVLVPSPELSEAEGSAVLASATQYLASETHGHVRHTEHGDLLVSNPGRYGQEIWPIPIGDMRGIWPFIVLITGLRRLGCGGRAAMGNDLPVPAVRRKFYESYRIAMPKEESSSPPGSPTVPHGAFGHGHHMSLSSSNSGAMSPPGGASVWTDPLLLNVVAMVKLIQSALAVWGLFGPHSGDDFEIDGLFCDETKAGIFRWRGLMGLEMDDAYKIERETSGGCIDPRTLIALLTSVTSVRYQLASLGIERLPKNPFSSPRHFLSSWRAYQSAYHPNEPRSKYLSVNGIRSLNGCYVQGRKGHASDALKVHRFLLSGVASATSSISANLKGGASDDSTTPLRKREHPMMFGDSDHSESGLEMIVPEAPPDMNAVSAPDTITSDIDAYQRLLFKSREKEWDVMGARPIAELFKGQAPERGLGGGVDDDKHFGPLRAFRRRLREDDDDDLGGVGSSTIGKVKGMRSKTGAALKGSFALAGLGRRGMSDASDSEGTGKVVTRRNVPTVNIEQQDDDPLALSRSPSPGTREPNTPANRAFTTSPTVHSPLQQSLYIGGPSGDASDVSGGSTRRSSLPVTPAPDRRRSIATMSVASTADRSRSLQPIQSHGLSQTPSHGPSQTASHQTTQSIPNPNPNPKPYPRNKVMVRTASDGADVLVAPDGNEFAIANPHGTGRREEIVVDGNVHLEPQTESDFGIDRAALKRTNSFQNRSYYRDMRVKSKDHLAVDVEMCALVWELRRKERALAKRTEDMMAVEKSAFAATQAMLDAARGRRDRVEALEADVRGLQYELSRAANEDVDEDRALQWASSKVVFFLSEDTNIHELSWQLRELEKHWESMREEREDTAEVLQKEEAKQWWRLGY